MEKIKNERTEELTQIINEACKIRADFQALLVRANDIATEEERSFISLVSADSGISDFIGDMSQLLTDYITAGFRNTNTSVERLDKRWEKMVEF